MHVTPDPREAGRMFPGAFYAVGNFDGVHVGHRKLFSVAQESARKKGRPWGILTFEPHPAKVLAPDLAPRLITTPEDKLRLLSESNPDVVVPLAFDEELAGMGPERFVSHVLVDALRVGGVVVGYDFTFGRGRKGSTGDLEGFGARFGFRVHVVPPVDVGGIVASSTKVRAFVLAGRVFAASLLLGRPFTLTGRVVHGDGRGKEIGFPTANLDVEQELLPAPGVYACWCCVEGEHVPAAVDVGRIPTFKADGDVIVEAHLIDWSGDLYGRLLQVEFVRRLRDEKRFPSGEALVEQIAADVTRTRAVVMSLSGDPVGADFGASGPDCEG